MTKAEIIRVAQKSIGRKVTVSLDTPDGVETLTGELAYVDEVYGASLIEELAVNDWCGVIWRLRTDGDWAVYDDVVGIEVHAH
jgi:hypothetical protein